MRCSCCKIRSSSNKKTLSACNTSEQIPGHHHHPRLQALSRVPRDHVNRAAPTDRLRRSRSMAGGRARQGPTAPPKPLIRASVSVTASDPPRMPPHIAETRWNTKLFLYPLLEHQFNLLGPRGRHATVTRNQAAEVSPSLEEGEPGT